MGRSLQQWPHLVQTLPEHKHQLQDDLFDVCVIKPAVQDVPDLITNSEVLQSKDICVTSYMDHPVGQMFAAFEASLLQTKLPDQVLVCGLLSQDCYEPNEFSKALNIKDNILEPVEGIGIGFDKLLSGLEWQPL